MKMFEIRLLDESNKVEEYIRLPVKKEFIEIINDWLQSKNDINSGDSE